jgi:hypothetical protein
MLSGSLFDNLSSEEYDDLKSIYSMYEGEELLLQLKKFFNEPIMFYKVKSLKQDPMWVANEIFINGYRYGLKNTNK